MPEIYSEVLSVYYPRWRQNAIDSIFWVIQDRDDWYERTQTTVPKEPAEELIEESWSKIQTYTKLMQDYSIPNNTNLHNEKI